MVAQLAVLFQSSVPVEPVPCPWGRDSPSLPFPVALARSAVAGFFPIIRTGRTTTAKQPNPQFWETLACLALRLPVGHGGMREALTIRGGSIPHKRD